MSEINEEFKWKQEPEAEAVIVSILNAAISENEFLQNLQNELIKGTSTDLLAWLDYIGVGFDPERVKRLEEVGFHNIHTRQEYQIYRHPGAKLADIALIQNFKGIDVGISVESIAAFLEVRGLKRNIEGSPFSPFRRALVSQDSGIRVWVVERRGVEFIDPVYENGAKIEEYLIAKERWMTRSRLSQDEETELLETETLANSLAEELGEDRAACLVLECERDYWERKNLAAQVQKNRQDRLGMGWANHDHHTFRSSRRHFQQLVKIFEILGFHCRERFYAGQEAGWGAQVMENPRAKLVLFLDVDLSPEEIGVDFAHETLEDRDTLGTIGLWCGLHGDSLFKAGMHHLEAQFEFDLLKQDLEKTGIGMMDPFSNFSYLKQAFTKGEVWAVNPERIELLLKNNLISKEQAEQFLKQGALGSHMENLQRKDGYKGFNQKNVSIIIQETDPRRVHGSIPQDG